jgi:hypothetical protein
MVRREGGPSGHASRDRERGAGGATAAPEPGGDRGNPDADAHGATHGLCFSHRVGHLSTRTPSALTTFVRAHAMLPRAVRTADARD